MGNDQKRDGAIVGVLGRCPCALWVGSMSALSCTLTNGDSNY